MRLELRPALQFRGHDEPVSTAVPEAYPLHALGARIELDRARAAAAAAAPPRRPRTDVRDRAAARCPTSRTRSRRAAATRRAASCTAPGGSAPTLAPGGRSRCSRRPSRGRPSRTIDRRGGARRRDRAPPAPARCRAAGRAHRPRRRARARRRPVRDPPGRPPRRSRARAGRRRRGVDRDRRLPLVHRLGPRHDDLARGPDAVRPAASPRPARSCACSRTTSATASIPNMFPEGANEGLYHTADATLWFFHAIDRYLRASGDQRTLRPAAAHAARRSSSTTCAARASASASIPPTACSRQGAAGYQLTWMDAKVGDWVVTPRRGKAVEINALWYNALRLMRGWLGDAGDRAGADELARRRRPRARRRSTAGSGTPRTGHLFDVVDGEHGDDPACRPNQLFAISLPHPVLDAERWRAGARASSSASCSRRSACARSSPSHPDYKPTLPRRPAARATPPTTRARCGAG